MAASRPNFGFVALDIPSIGAAAASGARNSTLDGSWRPDKPFLTGDGLKVTMRRAAGLTPADVLRVPLRFQVPPTGDLRRPYRFNWTTYDTIAGGQRARPGGPQLLEISIDTLLMDRLVAEASSGVVVWDGAPDPQRVLEELRYIGGMDQARKGPQAPFRLVINQPAVWAEPIVNIVAVLTAVEPTQQAGSVATEYLGLTFLELPDQDDGEQRPNAKPKHTHKLRAGDTLHAIATKHLHRASAWRSIADANGISGVSPNSASELAAWAKKHHKTSLVIPTTITTGVRTP